MELKFLTIDIYVDVRMFQSYLYGIEIEQNKDWYQLPHTVSIVPLWNWNTTSCVTVVSLKEFQSYLYGIEMQYRTQRSCKRLRVSIVPLWNWNTLKFYRLWKQILQVSIVPLWNWNSDNQFYAPEAFPVSIVPLWNWNRVCGVSFTFLRRFQSYLYGIEITLPDS